MTNQKKITVVGSGYVGMSIGVLLAQKNDVTFLDIDKKRVDMINNKISTIVDERISDFLMNKDLSISAVSNDADAYNSSDFIIIATPTDYDPSTNKFNTKTVDAVVGNAISNNKDALIVIKSTIPIGHVSKLKKRFNSSNIIFSPEFLREGQALHDNLNPSRIVIGGHCNKSVLFAEILSECAEKKNIEVLFMSSTEAEAVKLFANTYLAMRVSFFNELDSYAETYDLDSKNIINGMCLDQRIGNGYNNPSFGYGGYCLPKDTKQMLANFKDVPQNIMEAIVLSNETRKNFIANSILSDKPNTIGVYRLIMKSNSDNFRSSAIQDIIELLINAGKKVLIYEPTIDDATFNGLKVINNYDQFITKSDVVIANRVTDELLNSNCKIYSRDVFGDN